MARHITERWKISYGWLRGEDYWGDPVSDNFVRIDMLLHPWVLSTVEVVPPQASPAGAMYIVGTGGTGAWEGRDNNLAIFTEFGWVFCEPLVKGIRVGSEAPAGWLFWNGTAWVDEANVAPDPPAIDGTKYDITFSVGFEAEPLETVAVVPIVEDMVLAAGAIESYGRTESPPASVVRIALMRNFTEQVGTIQFIPGSVQAEFIVTGDKQFPRGSALSFKMPDAVPDYFRNYGATLRFHLLH